MGSIFREYVRIRHVETSLFFKATTLFVLVIAFSFFNFIKNKPAKTRFKDRDL